MLFLYRAIYASFRRGVVRDGAARTASLIAVRIARRWRRFFAWRGGGVAWGRLAALLTAS